MSDEQQPYEEKPSLLSRIGTGIKGFFKHALSYIPSGIIMTGLIFAGSAMLEGMTGMKLLNITGMVNEGMATGAWGGLAAKFGTHLAIGSILSGAIGGVSDAIKAGGHHVEPFVAPSVGQNKKPEQSESQGLEHMIEPVKKLAIDAVMPGLSKMAETTSAQVQSQIPNLVKQIQR
jgi:hypothetical protein